jgi:ribosomal protein L10
MSKIGLTKRRKIYATSEERKQRNRQAQAAFRERRTEYIKQLESTIKHHEDTLQNLQNSHRNAADECLMLRYKNSLLERVLLEKGDSSPLSSLSRGPTLIGFFFQALTSRPSCAQRMAAPI